MPLMYYSSRASNTKGNRGDSLLHEDIDSLVASPHLSCVQKLCAANPRLTGMTSLHDKYITEIICLGAR